MGCCINKVYHCFECGCWICCACGMLYQRYEEGNLDCETIKRCGSFTTTVMVEDLKRFN